MKIEDANEIGRMAAQGFAEGLVDGAFTRLAHSRDDTVRAFVNMTDAVNAVNVANGWFDKSRSFGEDIALLHSEASEALEAYRDHGLDDATKTCDVHGEYHRGTHKCTGDGKPEGVGSELADVLIRLLDTCSRYNIDLPAEFERKIKYNATRGNRHGGKNL